MAGPDRDEFVRRAEEIYAARLRAVLEPEHMDKFLLSSPIRGIISWARRSARPFGPHVVYIPIG